jgi:hypothetical protein
MDNNMNMSANGYIYLKKLKSDGSLKKLDGAGLG